MYDKIVIENQKKKQKNTKINIYFTQISV